MTENTSYLSILTLKVNGLNSSKKKHRITDWIKKQNPTICCLQEMYLNQQKQTLTQSEKVEKDLLSK
jgi:exonuclease III